MGQRVKSIRFDGQAVTALHTAQSVIETHPNDTVILALPPAPAAQILSDINVPLEYSAIVNLHFKLNANINVDWPAPLIGLIGGTAQWVFVRDNLASVTISAGNDLLGTSAENLAQTVWNEIASLFNQDKMALPPYRVIKEKRATLAQTPELESFRPSTKTAYNNLFLAGDWTDTGLPATIEGAIRSGYKAADMAQSQNKTQMKVKVSA